MDEDASQEFDIPSTSIDVCVCSFRRPEIVGTLEGIAALTVPPTWCIRVVVADNTASGEMRDVVGKCAARVGLKLAYVHAPAGNIAIARNACLEASEAEWIAFLDDDESPSVGWLVCLLREALCGSWTAVLGPVRAIYPDSAPRWARHGDLHSTFPVWVEGEIRTGYTGNLLLRRSFVQRHGLRFSLELGRSGGEDADFLYRLFDSGGRIGFAADAIVSEHVPLERTSMRWILKRSFRAGQSHGARLSARGRATISIAVASAKLIYCSVGAALLLPHVVSRNRFLARAALHAGVVARLAGLSEISIY